MLKQLINFYKVSSPRPCNGDSLPDTEHRMKRLKWATFLSATIGYGMYYVCRLSLNVVKKPIVDEGIFSETELGIIGSVLFFTYAVGDAPVWLGYWCPYLLFGRIDGGGHCSA